MRPIDADAFDKVLSDAQNECKKKSGGNFRYGFLSTVRANMLKQPTVDAPVMHGRWKWLSSTYDRTPCEKRYMCSKCRHETITHEYKPWEKYCPNCGAKMDLEDER